LFTFPEQSSSNGSNATFNLWTGMFGMAFPQQLWTLLFADDEVTWSNTDCKFQSAAYKLHQIIRAEHGLTISVRKTDKLWHKKDEIQVEIKL
jgi:hypothetical protein